MIYWITAIINMCSFESIVVFFLSVSTYCAYLGKVLGGGPFKSVRFIYAFNLTLLPYG